MLNVIIINVDIYGIVGLAEGFENKDVYKKGGCKHENVVNNSLTVTCVGETNSLNKKSHYFHKSPYNRLLWYSRNILQWNKNDMKSTRMTIGDYYSMAKVDCIT